MEISQLTPNPSIPNYHLKHCVKWHIPDCAEPYRSTQTHGISAQKPTQIKKIKEKYRTVTNHIGNTLEENNYSVWMHFYSENSIMEEHYQTHLNFLYIHKDEGVLLSRMESLVTFSRVALLSTSSLFTPRIKKDQLDRLLI